MPTFDNPAACLVAALDAVQCSNGNEQATKEWLKILGVPDDQLAAGIADLNARFMELKAAVDALPESEDSDLLRQHFPQVERVLNELLAIKSVGQMKHYRSLVNGETVYSMRACAGALRRNNVQTVPTLDDDGIQELLILVRDLVDEVTNADLPPKIQMFMVRKLRDIEDLLLGIRIAGYDAIVRMLDELVGGTMRAADGDKSGLAKAAEFIGRLWAKLTQVASGTTAVTGAVDETMRLLGS